MDTARGLPLLHMWAKQDSGRILARGISVLCRLASRAGTAVGGTLLARGHMQAGQLIRIPPSPCPWANMVTVLTTPAGRHGIMMNEDSEARWAQDTVTWRRMPWPPLALTFAEAAPLAAQAGKSLQRSSMTASVAAFVVMIITRPLLGRSASSTTSAP